MKKSNVVYYVGNFDKPDGNAAGKRVYGNALIFEKLGYKVVLVGKSKNNEINNYPVKYSHSIFYYSFPRYSLIKNGAYLRFFTNLVKIEGDAKVVIRYGTPCFAIFDTLLTRYCNKHEYPIIADVVDWLSSKGINPLFSIIKSIDTYLEKAIYNKKCDGIIAISTFLANYYIKHGCKNVIVIPPLVEEYTIYKSKAKHDVVKLVYAGAPFRKGQRIIDTKEVKDRIDLVILALAELDYSIQFDIYGLTKEEYLTAFPNHDSRINTLNGTVFFHGGRPMKEIHDAVGCADLTILLRDHTKATDAGFPTKVVESLSLGTPVITTSTSDLSDYIIHKENGFLVTITNLEDLRVQLNEAISYYLGHYAEMKENCYSKNQLVPSRFTDTVSSFLERV